MQRKFCAVTIEVSAKHSVNPAIKKSVKLIIIVEQLAAVEKKFEDLLVQKA